MKTKLFKHGWLCRRCRSVGLVGLVAAAGWIGGTVQAKPLGQATVTQVNNDVRFKPGAGNERAAKAKDVVTGSDTVRTGQKSQAELEFEDRTITRLGSNSTFTFDPDKREFQLKKGLLLFDMPKGAGGGKIITPAGTAAIEGTAGIVSYRSAPKIICLAGTINVLDPNGKLLAKVMPGQLFIVGVTKYPVDFMLNGLKTGKLMKGGLPNNSQEFDNSNNNQLGQLQAGQLQATPFVMLGEKTEVFVATAATTQNQYTQGTQQQVSSLSQAPTTPPEPFIIDSSSTIDMSVGAIVSGDGSKLPGTAQGATTVFDFGSQNVTVTGNPQITPDASGVMNASFNTQGKLVFLSVPDDTSTGSPTETGSLLTFNASTISFIGSYFKIGGTEASPSSLWLYGPGGLVIDPSTIRVRSGPTDDINPTGLLHIESTGGQAILAGYGYDSIYDPSDRLRSHLSATVNTGSGVYNGGTIEIISKGSLTGGPTDVTTLLNNGIAKYKSSLGASAPIALDGVYIHDTTLDVSPRDDHGAPSYGGNGGTIFIGAKSNTDDPAVSGWGGNLQVVIEDSVDINADGQVPGKVKISSSGNDALPGRISLNVPNSTGHINISAQYASYGYYGSSSSGDDGSIGLWGSSTATPPYKSIILSATGPAGGGTITANAYGLYYKPDWWLGSFDGAGGGINFTYASLDASAPLNSAKSGGAISLQAPQINLSSTSLSANGDGSGNAGQIKLTAVNPNGTHLNTQVSINNSALTTGGATAVPESGIFISGDSVVIDSASASALDSGNAQVHIQSRGNTGFSSGWLWSPLYYIMDNSTTMDVSGAATPIATPPTITGSAGTITGTFNGNTAVFDFVAQNILLWPLSPQPKPYNGMFEAEFRTKGSFEALDMTSGGGGEIGPKTDHVSIHAAGIQIVNSTFDMSGSDNGPGKFQLFSTTDLIVASPKESGSSSPTPSTLAPESGLLNSLNTGGTLHLESAGVTALGGGANNSGLTQVLVGAADVGGTVEIISTGDGTGPGGSAEGVHIRNALIDASHPFTSSSSVITLESTPAMQGGTVVLNSVQQISLQDTTITVEGQTAGGTVVVEGMQQASLQNTTINAAGQNTAGTVVVEGVQQVSLQDTTINAVGQATGGQVVIGTPEPVANGSQVNFGAGNMQITMDGKVDIRADGIGGESGGTAGSIRISSTGNSKQPGSVTMDVPDTSGHIYISAQVNPYIDPIDGDIQLLGVNESSTTSLKVMATGYAGGGSIQLNAVGDIIVQGANIETPVLETLGLPAGQIVLRAASDLQIHDSYLDASPGKPDNFISSGPNPNAAGGSIILHGGMSVSLFNVNDWLTITADGPTSSSPKATAAGQIIVESPGDVSTPGNILIAANNSSGYLRLSALDSQVVYDNQTFNGDIDILGSGMRSSGNESVQIVASGPACGGTISVETSCGSVKIFDASLDASTPSGAAYPYGGTISLLAGTSLEMDGARVDASSYVGTSSQGGAVNVQAVSVGINGDSSGGSTAISADGETAGNISVVSSSGGSTPGNVTIAADATHYVRLSAQDSATVFNALSTGGNIDILGASGRTSGNETVQIIANGPAGGGNISIAAVQNLCVINAQLNASGAINLSGQNVLVQNSTLIAGLISINAYSSASILSSILTAPYINVYSPTVDFAGSTLNGNAQVYANNVTHQPASGTITLHPYQPKP